MWSVECGVLYSKSRKSIVRVQCSVWLERPKNRPANTKNSCGLKIKKAKNNDNNFKKTILSLHKFLQPAAVYQVYVSQFYLDFH